MNEQQMPQQQHVPDSIIAQAAQATTSQLAQLMQQLGPMFAQAAQVVQAKTPQPQLDPAIQKTFEAAMAETQRKAKLDEGTLMLRDKELCGSAQLEAARQQHDLQLQGLQERVEAMRQQHEARLQERDQAMQAAELRAQQIGEMAKTQADNEARYRTAIDSAMVKIHGQLQQIQMQQPSEAEQLKEVIDMIGQLQGGGVA